MVISVSHLTDQVEITGGGHARILSAARGPAFPPAGPPTPVAAFDSCTLTPLRGYDDPFQFQRSYTVHNRSNPCYHLSFLYDDADAIIDRQSGNPGFAGEMRLEFQLQVSSFEPPES